MIIWCDLMKCGRMTGGDVNDFAETMAAIFKKNPQNTVALVIAPYLVSEKVGDYRGELRRGTNQ